MKTIPAILSDNAVDARILELLVTPLSEVDVVKGIYGITAILGTTDAESLKLTNQVGKRLKTLVAKRAIVRNRETRRYSLPPALP